MAKMKGTHAVVVGASSGLGHKVAQLLLQQGWHVGLAARRAEPLDNLCRQWPHTAVAQTMDICRQDAPQQLDSLIDRLGGMNLYFHAAGIGWHNIGLDPDKELATVNTNALAFTRMMDAAFSALARNPDGGHIAAITSVAGTKGLGAAAAYSATKAFQSAYLQALDQLAHLRNLPITITDIRPGFVATDLLAGQHYPMLMQPDYAARRIVSATLRRQRTATIDRRWLLLTALWRRVPRWLWPKLPIR